MNVTKQPAAAASHRAEVYTSLLSKAAASTTKRENPSLSLLQDQEADVAFPTQSQAAHRLGQISPGKNGKQIQPSLCIISLVYVAQQKQRYSQLWVYSQTALSKDCRFLIKCRDLQCCLSACSRITVHTCTCKVQCKIKQFLQNRLNELYFLSANQSSTPCKQQSTSPQHRCQISLCCIGRSQPFRAVDSAT